LQAAGICAEKGYREIVPELVMSVYLKSKNIPLYEISGIRINILRTNGEKFSINSDENFRFNSPLCFYKPSIERCLAFLPVDTNELEKNGLRLACKYISWIFPENKEVISDYISFYEGNWISYKKIVCLIKISHDKKVFSDHVLRDFFEISFWNSRYNIFKKIFLATVLAAKGQYGFLYFGVIKKKLNKKWHLMFQFFL
jgi:hypothetical protein